MQVLDKGRQRIIRPDGDRRLKLPLDLRCEAAQTLSPVSGHVKAKPWEAWRGIPRNPWRSSWEDRGLAGSVLASYVFHLQNSDALKKIIQRNVPREKEFGERSSSLKRWAL